MTLTSRDRLNPDGLPIADAPVLEKGRVLLLDEDPCLHEVIHDFLADHGYTVVAVRNCDDGVQEVLAGDFAVILCDLVAPGETFYRTVERIRPWFCTRFIFMADSRADVKMIDFVRSIGSFSLKKPFPMNDLLGLLVIAEVRGKHRSVFESGPDAPLEDPGSALPDAARTPRAARPAQTFPDTSTDSLSPVLPPPRAFALLAQSLPVVLALALGCEFLDARRDAATESAAQLGREAEWQEVAPQLDKALANRPKLDRALEQAARLTADRARARWTSALRGIAMAAGKEIKLLDIDARPRADDSGACEVRVRGVAGGSEPRIAADRFREAVEENVRRNAGTRKVSARFEQLEEEPNAPGALSEQHRAGFAIVAVVAPVNPPAAMTGERR